MVSHHNQVKSSICNLSRQKTSYQLFILAQLFLDGKRVKEDNLRGVRKDKQVAFVGFSCHRLGWKTLRIQKHSSGCQNPSCTGKNLYDFVSEDAVELFPSQSPSIRSTHSRKMWVLVSWHKFFLFILEQESCISLEKQFDLWCLLSLSG